MKSISKKLKWSSVLAVMLVLSLAPCAFADEYVGGIPLTTVQSGTVSGGLYVDAELPSWGSVDVTKTFASIPSIGDIVWARLYVLVYAGSMQNNYRGTATVSFDGNGDGTFETILGNEVLDTPGGYTYPGEGRDGPITVNDHCNRVTSDYLIWYDVSSNITSQTPKCRVVTEKTDSSFDGRIKMITLVVAYNDGDTDKVYYWVNQGHDVDSYLDDTPYSGQTFFDLSSLSGEIEKATLVVNHLASTDGTYKWNGESIPTDPSSGNSQGAFSGYNIWDLSSKVIPGGSNHLTYDRTANFYKIPLATLSVEQVSSPPCDLEVTLVNPVAANVFAKEPNTVRITVRNNGAGPSPATEVRLTSSDGFEGRGSVPSIPAGKTTIVPVTDTTVRDLAGGTVTYTATVDPDNTIPETSEGNNEKSSAAKTVLYNGYKGSRYWEGKSDVLTARTFDLRGNLLFSHGDSVYKAGGVGGSGWSSYTVTWTASDIPLPTGAAVREARLYVPYTWDDAQQVPDHFHLTFNGNAMAPESHYTDKSNFGGYANHVYGLLAYNVTQWFNPAENTALLSKDNVNTNLAMYGLTLAVVYEDPASARRQVFLNEGFDLLGADETQYGTTPEEATAYIPFSGMTITPEDAVHASLTTFVPSGNGPEGDLLLNGVTIDTGVWDYGLSTGTQVAVDTRDVKSSLLTSGNEAGIRSTATGATPVMAASLAFLVIEYPESGPVAGFSVNVTSGTAPLAVQFTDQSTGQVTSWAWDFENDGIIDSTEQNPTYTYTSQGTYTVNLTVTGPDGSDSEVKTGFITATGPSHPDLVITQVTTNADELFAHESNTINATVSNDGTADAGVFTVRINASGAVYNVSIPGLDHGEQQQVQVTDTTLRTMGDSVTITATADPGNAITESDETNNALTITKTVVNNGYKGKRWTGGDDLHTVLVFDGPYEVVYSAGDSAYRGAKWLFATANWTSTDLPVPTGATVIDARLYQGYSYNKMGTDPAFAASFNGNTVSPVATYRDTKGYGSYNYPYGLYVYNVTDFFNSDGNTLVLTPEGTPGTTNDYSLYGAYLVVTYSDSATTEKQIWINEEFDMVYSGSARSVTSDEGTTYAVFAGIDTTDMTGAEAVAILASAGDTGKSRFFFNEYEYTGFWEDYIATPQIGFSVYDVTDALSSGENTARLQSYDSGNGGDNMYAMTTILIVEKSATGIFADFKASSTSGEAPLAVQFTDQSTGSPVSWAWDFENNGIIDSTEQDPTWIYNSAGTYTVNLTVTNAAGSDSEVKTDFITVTPPQQGEPTIILSPSSPHVAEGTTCDFQIFVSSLPEGLAGYDLVVSLSNPSIAEITGVQYPGWAVLNDTTPLPPTDSLRLSGVDLDKSVQAGAVNVLLATITVRADSMGTSAIAISNVNMDADGGSIITPDISSGQVVVHAPLVADFTANVTSGKASLARPLFVQFTDLSTGDPPVSSWSWDFDNNGVVDSTLQDPVASFNKPGNYTVNLTVQNTYSSDTEVKVDYIRVTSLVKPFPGQTNEPTDPDGDGLYEDINGNGRLDYDDVVIYYENMQWIRDQLDVGIEPYDYNGNGRIDYDDVVLLYEEVLDSRP